jgi:CrcB protein
MRLMFLIFIGGGAGSVARYLLALASPRGTLYVNLIGSFCIAAVMALLRPSDLRIALVTGVLGGFTTYSSFNEETMQLLRNGMWSTAGLYVLATVAGCLVAGALGFAAAQWVRA